METICGISYPPVQIHSEVIYMYFCYEDREFRSLRKVLIEQNTTLEDNSFPATWQTVGRGLNEAPTLFKFLWSPWVLIHDKIIIIGVILWLFRFYYNYGFTL